jgi:hypothetical protein
VNICQNKELFLSNQIFVSLFTPMNDGNRVLDWLEQCYELEKANSELKNDKEIVMAVFVLC